MIKEPGGIMSENLRLARLYFLLLAIVTAGRWYLGVRGVPYDQATDKISIVILTMFASLFYAAFCRRWRGFSLLQAVAFAALLGVTSQLVILASTVVSYLAGLETYFNHPKALNVQSAIPLGAALAVRAQGLVANTIINSIVGMLGWAMGGLLPADRK
jgi:hypothetical protein